MGHRITSSSALLLVLGSLAASCAKTPQVPPVATPVAPTVPLVTAPPARCEVIGEACVAKGDTRARIAQTSLDFAPVGGWRYAQGLLVTLAQLSSEGAGVALSAHVPDAKDARKNAASRDATLSVLTAQLGLAAMPTKLNWAKADMQRSAGDLKLKLWGARGKRAGADGSVLVITAPVSATQVLVGLAFVPDSDTSGAEQSILTSLDSIRPAAGRLP